MSQPDPLLKLVPPGGRPEDIHAADAVLGAALIDSRCMDDLARKLCAEDFYATRHQVVWSALFELYRDGRAIDQITLNEWLAAKGQLEVIGGTAAIAELTEKVPTAANALIYADTVLRTADFRRLIRAAAEVTRFAYRAPPAATPGDVQAEADRLVRAVLPDRTTSGGHLGVAVDEVLGRAERGERPPTWSTGLADLDDRLGGGLRPGALNLLAARPSMGKTALLTRIARHLAFAGIGCSLFSLETSRHDIALNMLAAESRVPRPLIEKWTLNEEEFGLVQRARDDIRRAPLQVHDSRTTLGKLIAAIRHDARKLGTRVVAIDYIQLVDPDAEGRSRAEEVAAVSRELKLLALDLGVSILAAAQLSRDIEKRSNKFPQMSDLRESGSLEQDADVIMLLHRPHYYDPSNDDLLGLAHVDVVKQRSGPTGVVNLAWIAQTMRFEDLPRECAPSAPRRSRGGRHGAAAAERDE